MFYRYSGAAIGFRWCFLCTEVVHISCQTELIPSHDSLLYLNTVAEAEAPVLWPPDAKSQLTGKDPDTGKDWRQKEKGAAEDEMVR